ncbi:MAG: hypothetical protein U1E91_03790 [Moraxella sp.]
MIELSNNHVALNLAKFIYEEEAKLTPNKHQQESDIKEYIFELYEERVAVVEETTQRIMNMKTLILMKINR